MKRYKLLALGAWQFFHDAYSGVLPDPFGTPQAVIVSTVRYEPFVARGNVQFHKRLKNFTRGIEHARKSLVLDPLDYDTHLVLVFSLAISRRHYVEAIAATEPVLELFPEDDRVYS